MLLGRAAVGDGEFPLIIGGGVTFVLTPAWFPLKDLYYLLMLLFR